MNKIYRLIGKEGRTTIPFDIRLKMRIGYNSLLSYASKTLNLPRAREHHETEVIDRGIKPKNNLCL